MKNVMKILVGFMALLPFASCEKEALEETNSNNINFEKLALGQKSLYVGWVSKNLRTDSDTTFKQTTDTLSLTVVSEDARGFKIAEEHLNKRIATQYYYFQIKGDSLLVKPQHDSITYINSPLVGSGIKQFLLKDNRQVRK